MPILGQPSGVPTGTISIWTGLLSTIPNGWLLCDGTNGTPDLRNVFPKCVPNAGTNPGNTGGVETVTLTESQIASHRHSFSVSNHEHDGDDNDVEAPSGTPSSNIVLTGQAFGINDLELDISTTHLVGPLNNRGSGVAHNNIPHCKDVLYIQRV